MQVTAYSRVSTKTHVQFKKSLVNLFKAKERTFDITKAMVSILNSVVENPPAA
jgi:hypothetical protein